GRRFCGHEPDGAYPQGTPEVVVGLHAGCAALLDLADDANTDSCAVGEGFLCEASTSTEFDESVGGGAVVGIVCGHGPVPSWVVRTSQSRAGPLPCQEVDRTGPPGVHGSVYPGRSPWSGPGPNTVCITGTGPLHGRTSGWHCSLRRRRLAVSKSWTFRSAVMTHGRWTSSDCPRPSRAWWTGLPRSRVTSRQRPSPSWSCWQVPRSARPTRRSPRSVWCTEGSVRRAT